MTYTQNITFTKKQSPLKTYLGFDTVSIQYVVTNEKAQIVLEAQFITSCKLDNDLFIGGILLEFKKEELEVLLCNDFSYSKIEEIQTMERVINTVHILLLKSINPETLDDSRD